MTTDVPLTFQYICQPGSIWSLIPTRMVSPTEMAGLSENTAPFTNFESSVVATGTNEEKLNDLKKKYPNIIVEKFKLDEHDKIENFIESVYKKLDGLDVLINNAGITLDNLSIRLTNLLTFVNNSISCQFIHPNQNFLY